MKTILLFFISVLWILTSCKSQKLEMYFEIKNKIESGCEELKDSFGINGDCNIYLSTRIIPINVTPFHLVLDSLSHFPINESGDSFSMANLFDLNNYKEPYENEELNKYNRQEKDPPNIRIYCSDKYVNVVTCDVVEVTNNNLQNEIYFGKSILYLFEFDNMNKIKWISSTTIQKN